jgi:hypothetical protein
MKKKLLLASLILAIVFAACKKESETLTTAELKNYAPMAVGKYITYKLDSFVYINFGTKDTTISYEVKYEVDAAITDNLGRPAYRIIRYIRKTAANQWQPDNTFSAVHTTNGFEFIENNMRFLKLKLPVKDGYAWKGNSYIDTYSLNSDVKYLDDWDYVYDSVNTPMTLGSFSLDSTFKVDQRNEIIGNPGDPNSYSEINYGSENYAKGIGLVYKRFLHQEYQPPTPGSSGYRLGYGITLTMIGHN